MNRKSFDYFYIFVMILYMACADIQTRAMELYSTLISPIAYLIPIVLTLFFIKKHHIHFNNRNLLILTLILIAWSYCLIVKYTPTTFISSIFAIISVLIAYIHVQGLGKNLFLYFEDILVRLSKLSILLWGVGLLFPFLAKGLFSVMPGHDTGVFGDNFFYIFNWMNPEKGHVIIGTDISRNAGFSWESGRFAIMIVLAITLNLIRHNGIAVKQNKNLLWLLLTLVTTFSTTGYVSTMIIFTLFHVKKFDVKKLLVSLLIFPVFVALILNVSFLGEKMQIQLKETQTLEKYDAHLAWADQNFGQDEYAFSLERFPSMMFEYENIVHDPLVGYGKSPRNSYFYNNVSTNASITGGLLKVFAQYGILIGLLLYGILFISSKKIASDFNCDKRYALFFCFILMAVSYPIYGVCMFTSIWLYGIFPKKCN